MDAPHHGGLERDMVGRSGVEKISDHGDPASAGNLWRMKKAAMSDIIDRNQGGQVILLLISSNSTKNSNRNFIPRSLT